MSLLVRDSLPRSSVQALLTHLGAIDDPRAPWRVAHPLNEVLLLVVCATVCDCDDYDAIADWGEANLAVLRRHLPFHHGVPGGRWLTLLMNRIDPNLFAQVSTDCVRATWPARPDLVAIVLRQAQDEGQDVALQPRPRGGRAAAAHGVGLRHHGPPRARPGSRARQGGRNHRHPDPAGPVERKRRAQGRAGEHRCCRHQRHHRGRDPQGRRRRSPGRQGQPAHPVGRRRKPVRPCTGQPARHGRGLGQGARPHRAAPGRRGPRVDWLDGGRRFPGETRLPDAACLVRVRSRTEMNDRCRFDTRYYVSSAALAAERAGAAVRGHWAIENSPHWVLDVVFGDDQSRLRKGHGARTMAIVRHFAINLVRSAPDPVRPEPLKPQRRPKPGATPRPISLKRRRKIASWNSAYLTTVMAAQSR